MTIFHVRGGMNKTSMNKPSEQLLEQEFDQYADDYDQHLQELLGDMEFYSNHKVRALGSAGLLKPGMRMLDFGCGTGSLSRAVVDFMPDVQVDGYDVSTESIARVPASLRAQGNFTDNLSQIEGPYDLIQLTNVMHHVAPKERDSVLSDAAGKLIRGGALSIIEHNPLNPMTRKIVRDCPFDENAILLPASESRDRLARAIGPVVRVRFILFFPVALRALMPLETLLRWCPAGAQYLAYAFKTEIESR
jgi:2-polyprenyl-3-methyl-5-hydroxy-6-metoxy-1,4-benzoquinol methylase